MDHVKKVAKVGAAVGLVGGLLLILAKFYITEAGIWLLLLLVYELTDD